MTDQELKSQLTNALNSVDLNFDSRCRSFGLKLLNLPDSIYTAIPEIPLQRIRFKFKDDPSRFEIRVATLLFFYPGTAELRHYSHLITVQQYYVAEREHVAGPTLGGGMMEGGIGNVGVAVLPNDENFVDAIRQMLGARSPAAEPTMVHGTIYEHSDVRPLLDAYTEFAQLLRGTSRIEVEEETNTTPAV